MKGLNEYQKEAAKTIPENLNRLEIMDNAVYGLCGELGELVDHLKKSKFQGHFLDIEKIAYKLGDVLWYVAEMATGAGFSLDEIATKNIEKLRQRYGDKFNADKSINRKDNM